MLATFNLFGVNVVSYNTTKHTLIKMITLCKTIPDEFIEEGSRKIKQRNSTS